MRKTEGRVEDVEEKNDTDIEDDIRRMVEFEQEVRNREREEDTENADESDSQATVGKARIVTVVPSGDGIEVTFSIRGERHQQVVCSSDSTNDTVLQLLCEYCDVPPEHLTDLQGKKVPVKRGADSEWKLFIPTTNTLPARGIFTVSYYLNMFIDTTAGGRVGHKLAKESVKLLAVWWTISQVAFVFSHDKETLEASEAAYHLFGFAYQSPEAVGTFGSVAGFITMILLTVSLPVIAIHYSGMIFDGLVASRKYVTAARQKLKNYILPDTL